MTRLLPKWHIPLTSSHSFLRLAVTCLSWEAARSHKTMEKPVCSCSKSEAELRLWPSGLWRPVGIRAARGTRENLGASGSKAPEGTVPAALAALGSPLHGGAGVAQPPVAPSEVLWFSLVAWRGGAVHVGVVSRNAAAPRNQSPSELQRYAGGRSRFKSRLWVLGVTSSRNFAQEPFPCHLWQSFRFIIPAPPAPQQFSTSQRPDGVFAF